MVCCFLCGLPKFFDELIIESVIASVLKICALNPHGLLGNGTSFFHVFVLFLVPSWCPLIQRMGGTQCIGIGMYVCVHVCLLVCMYVYVCNAM